MVGGGMCDQGMSRLNFQSWTCLFNDFVLGVQQLSAPKTCWFCRGSEVGIDLSQKIDILKQHEVSEDLVL